MTNSNKSDFISWIIMIGVIILLIEIIFASGGKIIPIILFAVCIYFGKKKIHRLIGKILFWFGTISLFFTVINMATFKYLCLAVLVYFVFQFYQSKQKPATVKPEIAHNQQQTINEESLLKHRKPILENVFFGNQKTPNQAYQWNDINIQCGFGDTIIDLSNTVLPKEEAVISIRNVMGNVKILVPYEVECSVSHCALVGSIHIFDYQEDKIFNQLLHVETQGYDKNSEKIKIVTSMLIGNIEVKRI